MTNFQSFLFSEWCCCLTMVGVCEVLFLTHLLFVTGLLLPDGTDSTDDSTGDSTDGDDSTDGRTHDSTDGILIRFKG